MTIPLKDEPCSPWFGNCRLFLVASALNQVGRRGTDGLTTRGFTWRFLEARASDAAVKQRLRARETKTKEASDARLEDFEWLPRLYEPPIEVPEDFCVSVRRNTPLSVMLIAALRCLAQARVPTHEFPLTLSIPVNEILPADSIGFWPTLMQGALDCRRKLPAVASRKSGALVLLPLPSWRKRPGSTGNWWKRKDAVASRTRQEKVGHCQMVGSSGRL